MSRVPGAEPLSEKLLAEMVEHAETCGFKWPYDEAASALRELQALRAERIAAPASEPEPTCQHGVVAWCRFCDAEAREAVALASALTPQQDVEQLRAKLAEISATFMNRADWNASGVINEAHRLLGLLARVPPAPQPVADARWAYIEGYAAGAAHFGGAGTETPAVLRAPLEYEVWRKDHPAPAAQAREACTHPMLCFENCATCGEPVTITYANGDRLHNGIVQPLEPAAQARSAGRVELEALAAEVVNREPKEPASPRAVFDSGIAAAEYAVATVSAAGRTHDYALGLAAAGEVIHKLFDNDSAWEAASDKAWDDMAQPPQRPGAQPEAKETP